MTRRSFFLAVLFTILLAGAGVVRADDDDIFTMSAIQPNVVILIDTSGSMNDYVGGARKIDSAQAVITDLIQTVTGVRYTIFSFNDSSDGAAMVAPVGTATSTMVTEINALNATGYTPLGRATQDVEDYFNGIYTEGTSSRYGCGWTTHWYGRHSYRTWTDCPVVSYPTPLQYACQKNYLIIITDGMPNGEATSLVTTVAAHLYTTDHSTTLAGTQNVVVNTIGFDNTSGVTLLQQTATAGGGQYYGASNADDLAAALKDAMSAVIADSYRFVAPLVPSSSANGDTKAYLGSFTPSARSFWQGSLKAYQLDSNGLIPVDSSSQPLSSAVVWDGGSLLAAKAASTRTIYTEFSGSLVSFATTNGSITTTTLGVSSTTDKNNLINFIRGVDTYDEDHDGNTTEDRAWKLGDIYHSTPVLVFPPPLASTDSTYTTFKSNNASRTKVLLVGANDGMLHAFRASDGQELWSFIPNDLLNDLVNYKPTVSTHEFTVDSSPVVADVKISGTWKTIVVFGERRGGTYYHCLDVTDPTAPSFMWNFTDTRMGETWSEPSIGRVKIADGTTKYVAFVGGGYDTASNNNTGKAVFAIDLSNGSKLWQYYNTGSADALKMNFSIPASPAVVDLDGDGNLDRVYVGDIGGQLWKFDVSTAATFSSGLVNNWTGKRLFNSDTSAANPPASGAYYPTQAMYGRPAVAYDSSSNLWVYVGTGDRNHPNQSSSNRFYGILDNTTMTNSSALTESSLVQAPATNGTITQGWYLPLASNEKVLSGAIVHQGIVYFGSYTPSTTVSCDTPGGSALLYAVQMGRGDAAINWTDNSTLSGENSSTRSVAVGGGIPATPQVIPGSTNDTVVVSTTDGQITTKQRPRSAGKQVRYWREVY